MEQSKPGHLAPFSGELKVDKSLKLSCEEFKESIDTLITNEPSNDLYILQATSAFPEPYIFAQFANKVYTDYNKSGEQECDYETRLDLLGGWKLLTTASNTYLFNGYFGAAYWHPQHHQVVITHRGTELTNLGALIADFKGVFRNKYVAQMNSATTFADKVFTELKAISEKNPNVNLQLFFTGHSLGGWLAQITTFTTKYLEKIGDTFLKSSTVQENVHAHTVVFDSPGCADMLSKMKNTFDVRKNPSMDLKHLDITSYLSAPNRINTCNTHSGTVYRIFIDSSGIPKKNNKDYHLGTHSMDKIQEAFDSTTGQVLKDENGQLKIHEVVDWPIGVWLWGGKEIDDFLDWAVYLIDFHPAKVDFSTNQPAGYHPIRYQTRAYDPKVSSLSIFTQGEQQFLKRYHYLRKIGEFFKLEELLPEAKDNTQLQNNIVEKLQNFDIDDEQRIVCKDAKTLGEFIPYVKCLIQRFPHIKENTEKQFEPFQIRSKVYQSETNRYLKEIAQSPLDFNDNVVLDLKSFIENEEQQVWQIRMSNGDAGKGLTKVYKVFQKMEDAPNYTILKLKRLLVVNQLISLNTLMESTSGPHLLMVACETAPSAYDKVQTLFKTLFNTLIGKKHIKIILTTPPSDDGFVDFIQKTACETLGEQRFIKKDECLTWRDLTSDCQGKLLAGKKVTFQGHETLLTQLINLDSQFEIDDKILEDMLGDKPVEINNEPIRSSDLQAPYAVDQGNRWIEGPHLVQGKNTLLVISGLDAKTPESIEKQLASAEALNKEKGSRMIIFSCYEGKDILGKFDALCRDLYTKPHHKPEIEIKVIHWVAVEQNRLVLKKSVDFDFYRPRQLKHYRKVVLKHNFKQYITTADTKDVFIIETRSETPPADNPNCLSVISGTAEVTFNEKAVTHFKSVHWIKEEFEDGHRQLVWHRSHGTLEGLSEFFDKESSKLESLNDEEFSQIEQSVIIIIDEPGMGKSTALTHLSQKSLKTNWVIRLNFRELQPLLKQLNTEALDYDSVGNFLADSAGYSSDNLIQYFLLRFHLEHKTQKPLLLLLDGFDEIQNKDNKNKALKLLKFLKDKTPSSLRITARETDRQSLAKIYPLSSSFEALKPSDKETFLGKLWRVRFSLIWGKQKCDEIFSNSEDSKFKTYVTPLLLQIDAILGEQGSHFMGVPLQMQLLAVGFKEDFETFINSEATSLEQNHFKNLNLNEFYQRFMNVKYDLYLQEKSQAGLLNAYCKNLLKLSFTKAYQHLALQLLFSEEEALKLLNNKKNKYSLEALAEIGIIQLIEGYPDFIHRTVAEYLAADFFVKQLAKSPSRASVQGFLLNNLLIESRYQTIRAILNCQLTDKFPSHSTITECGKRLVEFWRVNVLQSRKIAETLFHTASEEGNGAIIVFLTKGLKEHPKTLKALVFAQDYRGHNALHYAAKSDYTIGAEQLLTSVSESLGVDILKELLKSPNREGYTTLHLAILNGHLNVAEVLIKHGADIEATVGRYHWTPLHLAAQRGQLKSAQFLLIKGANVFYRNYHDTVLHQAVSGNNIELITLILDAIRDKSNNEEERTKVINAQDNEGNTALMWAVEKGKSAAVRVLLNGGVDVNIKDKKNMTALNWAAKGEYWPIAVTLLKHGAEIKDLSSEQCDLLINHIESGPYDGNEQIIQSVKQRLLTSSIPRLELSGSQSESFELEAVADVTYLGSS